MISIDIESVEPLRLSDLVDLNLNLSIEDFVRVLLAAAKSDDVISDRVCSSLLTFVPSLHQVAVSQMRELLSSETVDLLMKQDFKGWGLWVLSDGKGTFASILEGRHALVGTREEIARTLSLKPPFLRVVN